MKDKTRLGDFVKIQGGYAFQSALFRKRGIPIIRISNIDGSTIELKNSAVYYDETKAISDDFIAKKDDLLIAMSGATTGKCGVYPYQKCAYVNQRVGKFILYKKDKVLYKYITYWTQSNNFERQLSKFLAAGAQPNVSPKNIEDMELFLPNMTKQQNAVAVLDAISANITYLQHLISKQENIKKSTEKMLLTPKPGWKEVKIQDCLDYEQPTDYIVHTDINASSGTTPVLTANKAFVLGYTDETNNIYNKGDTIIYDDFTMDMKYVTFPFKVKSSAMKILTPKGENNLYFMFALLKSFGLTQQEHARSYISKLEPMKILIPDPATQETIAENLYTIDSYLENLKYQLDKIKKLKQGLMSYFFG